jgi:hypothetical protein
MSKDFDTIERTNEIIETIATEVITLDELSLALIGGGEYVIAG